ncbi:MAG: AbrB/MazE/SpoVT family DNA-binding domain-containing protein [Propionibacteriaceae bacterium]|jgi:AbrB family looped-hinge helix DNA binding protein|nr:AbrB/MazE/SpoVT family DNA-binding domain-containing protein [Propionibacteriaceae bacterium]
MSSKGQVVIPAELRRQAGIAAGDALIIEIDAASKELRMRRAETIDELAERFTRFISPGTPPLTDASAHYQTRKPRL